MGIIQTKIILSNPTKPHLNPIEVEALVDTGASYLCLPKHYAIQLELEELNKREVEIANGESGEYPYAGPLKVQFQNRSCFSGAIIIGKEVLLGAIPMEDMDLVIHPLTRTITVNPDSPNIPKGLAK